MDGDLEFTGVRNNPLLEEVIGSAIQLTDFFDNTFSFKLTKYQADIIYVEVLDGEFKGKIIELDLGTNSNIPSPIKEIISKDGIPLFSQKQEIDDYLTEDEKKIEAIDIGNTLKKSRDYYKKRIVQVAELLSPEEAEKIAQQLIVQGLFTTQEVKIILSGEGNE